MSSLLGISEAASIGWHAMILLTAAGDNLLSNAEIADSLQVSGAHLSKVLQRLTRAGLIETERGPRGGFRLGRPATAITILEIYEAIEGPLQERRCLLRKPICNGKCCIIGDLLREIAEVKTAFANLTLQEATEKSLA
ncbi:MAG: Rrf2 family transcriptional regulator [Lentisphaeria bacterium]|jgi:Rrf2 family protein|nr:Rrf2 family transcriptional regulator [Lentisphaeria bacterium]